MRTDKIISNSRYTFETVIEDLAEFDKLLQDATRAVTPVPEVAVYFKMFDADYYSIASRSLDLKVCAHMITVVFNVIITLFLIARRSIVSI
jgi:hypothetical protein